MGLDQGLVAALSFQTRTAGMKLPSERCMIQIQMQCNAHTHANPGRYKPN